jgi:hypothetical protein
MPQNALMYRDIQASLKSIFPTFNERQVNSVPNCEVLNTDFDHQNNNNKNLTFIKQDESLPFPKMSYEERIYHEGIIATRSNNWHDFFNAMVWHNYPKIKASINTIHYQELQRQVDNKRSRQRDLLTLFDECGVIVIAHSHYLEMIRQHQWHELFVENKNSWLNGEIKIKTFGHAMFEKYLNPYIGMTAQALLLDKTPNNIDEFIADGMLNKHLLLSKKELSPLPLLGIPNWYPNQNSGFYSNKNYFR